MTGAPPVIREATEADVPRLVELAAELGYRVEAGVVRERVPAGACAGRAVAVFEAKAKVLGWVEVGVEETLVRGRRCRVTGIVVDARARGRGAGRALLAWAQRWAVSRGCAEAYLTTNVQRRDAHAVYERLGWIRRKTSHVYVRPLEGDGEGRERP